ncbi:hypothetical protein HOLleu_02263 [Holothuria leucospilota]|uniref:Uncharacterized protein n=1 Tax=Holothuria leucospilota TaxID=206669 RepID=A0A9Q1CRZ1_HOLLE|nr:hypothetical protein HOLleu_02263 [Holothuria leucospilota]
MKVKRGPFFVIEVTDDRNKRLADGYMRGSYPLVQFFAFSSDDWNDGTAMMRKASEGAVFYFFLSYNCVDEPQYCPSDVMKTSYRFYKNRELKKTVEGDDILGAREIRETLRNL